MLERYSPGEVVFLSFPHTDGERVTGRPAVVLLDVGDDDIIIARVTRHAARDRFDVEVRDWREAGLLYPSLIRPHKLATYLKRMVERRLGFLSSSDLAQLSQSVRRLWTAI